MQSSYLSTLSAAVLCGAYTALRCVVAMLVVALVAAPVCGFANIPAQSQQRDSLPKPMKTSKTPEITVTAMRQAERQLEVPLAVTLVPKEEFMNSRGFGFDEALSLVPGVLVQSRTGNQDVRVMVRGFGARGAGERSNAGTSRGLRFYIDGIPETEPDGRTAFDLIDLTGASSVEVLRSNASALWGNAAGGVVSVSTVPLQDKPFVAGQFMLGSFGFQKHSVRAGTVTDATKIYVSLNNTMFDGWREQSRSLLTQCNAGAVTKLASGGNLGVFLTGASNNFQIPGPLNEPQFNENPRQAQNNPMIYNPTYVQRNERRFNRLGRIGFTLDQHLDDQNNISAMAFLGSKYLQRSERNTFRDFTRYHLGGNAIYRNTSRLLQTPVGEAKNQFLVGIDQQYQDGAIIFYNQVGGERGREIRDNKREGASNFGAFVQNELSLAERLSLVVGARYDNITYYYDSFINPKTNEQRSFERVTPKAGLTYHLAPTMTLYANVGGGVEVPAGNETDPPNVFGEDTVRSINSLLEPIRSTTYEVGIKQVVEFSEESVVQQLSYDAAAYWIDVINDIVPYRGGRFYFTAGRSRRIGAELGAQARLQGGVALWGMASYGDNRFLEYRIDSVFVNRALQGRFADYAGNRQPGIPELFATVRVRYTPVFAPMVYVEGELRHVGSYFADDVNTLRVPSYTVLDALVGVQHTVFERLKLHAFVRLNNVTDATYIGSVWINPDRPATLPPAYIEPGLARNIIGSVALEWQL